MINQEALRIFMRKYREAELPQLVQTMETQLMDLLHKQSVFEEAHNAFIAHLLYQCRNDKS